jgi:hypothetical protein
VEGRFGVNPGGIAANWRMGQDPAGPRHEAAIDLRTTKIRTCIRGPPVYFRSSISCRSSRAPTRRAISIDPSATLIVVESVCR